MKDRYEKNLKDGISVKNHYASTAELMNWALAVTQGPSASPLGLDLIQPTKAALWFLIWYSTDNPGSLVKQYGSQETLVKCMVNCEDEAVFKAVKYIFILCNKDQRKGVNVFHYNFSYLFVNNIFILYNKDQLMAMNRLHYKYLYLLVCNTQFLSLLYKLFVCTFYNLISLI